MIHLIIMMIIDLALLHCTTNNELCNLNPFFPHVPFFTDLWYRHILMYSMSTDLLVKILFLIVAICGMIVACMNLCINEAMRRQAAYRLAWDQRIEWDQLHTTDNIIKVTVVWLQHERQSIPLFGSVLPLVHQQKGIQYLLGDPQVWLQE